MNPAPLATHAGRAAELRLLSVVIPARDKEDCIALTVQHLNLELHLQQVPHEIIVVDDGSSDRTWQILTDLRASVPELAPVQNDGLHDFGRAIVHGLNKMRGDAAVVMIADESDDSRDVVRYWKLLNEDHDCVFGSRFLRGGGVIDYPWVKLWLNRMANLFIRLLFHIRLNDTTSAFKAYRRTVIEGCQSLISPHFILTVELPLKAIMRGYTWTVIPLTSRNRRSGEAKLKIKEMGSRYLFICLTCAWKNPSAGATTANARRSRTARRLRKTPFSRRTGSRRPPDARGRKCSPEFIL